jgi:hypothetical protein
MVGLSIYKIPFIRKACMTRPAERTKTQQLVNTVLQWWIDIRHWWPRHAKKYDITTWNGQYWYTTYVGDRNYALYDKDGYLVGWQCESPEGCGYFKPVEEVHTDGTRPRMAFLSRHFSDTLPANSMADILMQDEDVIIGRTSYRDL